MKGAVLLCCALLLLLPSACAAQDSDALREAMVAHPARDPAWWGEGWRATPLAARVAPASPEVVAYVELDNALWGIEGRIEPAPPPAEIAPALEDIQAGLPPRFAELLDNTLVGVFTVSGLGSSGYIEEVRHGSDNRGGLAAVFLVLDSAVFQGRTANAWATWREGSFFTPQDGEGPSLRMRIAPPDGDTAGNAVRYILLHELGHCLGIASGAHPSWNDPPPDDLEPYPFVRLSWNVVGGDYQRRYESGFPWKMRLYAFEGSAHAPREMPAIHAAWNSETNAPSLYATVSPFEDFAESFAVYQHAIREGRPWSIEVETPRGEVREYASCFQTGACPDKLAFMAAWFGG